jgi:hypothetical protein
MSLQPCWPHSPFDSQSHPHAAGLVISVTISSNIDHYNLHQYNNSIRRSLRVGIFTRPVIDLKES